MEKWIRLGEYTCADSTRQKEFDDFYDNVHIPNILKAPGFVAATRYAIKEPMYGRGQYLLLYEIEPNFKHIGKRKMYFFSKRIPSRGTPCDMPGGYEVAVNKRTGLPYLNRYRFGVLINFY